MGFLVCFGLCFDCLLWLSGFDFVFSLFGMVLWLVGEYNN